MTIVDALSDAPLWQHIIFFLSTHDYQQPALCANDWLGIDFSYFDQERTKPTSPFLLRRRTQADRHETRATPNLAHTHAYVE